MFSLYLQTCNKNVIKEKKSFREMKHILFVLTVGAWACAASTEEVDPVVCLDRGCVRGKNFKGNLKEFEGFLGIPYAQPPVDELRLKVSCTAETSTRRALKMH